MMIFLLEESSAKAMIDTIMPKLLPDIVHKSIAFEGKQDLEKQLLRKLRAWKTPNTVFLIMRDQDSGNCKEIKQNLLNIVKNSGKTMVSLVRVVCHELESFYLGDLLAVELELKVNNLAKKQNKSKFRTPDTLSNSKQELKKVAKNYQQISGSEAIAQYLRLDGSNKSISFNMLINGIIKLAKQAT